MTSGTLNGAQRETLQCSEALPGETLHDVKMERHTLARHSQPGACLGIWGPPAVATS